MSKEAINAALDKKAENARELGLDYGVEQDLRVFAQINAMKQRKALAEQPAQQEPVTWGVDWGKAGDIPCVAIIKRLPGGGIEVVAVEYGPQRPWVGLTDEEVEEVWKRVEASDFRDCVHPFAQAIEAALRSKNT